MRYIYWCKYSYINNICDQTREFDCVLIFPNTTYL